MSFPGDADFSEFIFDDFTSFNDTHFRGDTWFSSAHFKGAATFQNTQFEGSAFFADTKFSQTPLFHEATFCDIVNFQGENTAKADLRGASFEGVELAGADLPHADLLGTVFRDADLHDANLSSAHGLLGPQFGGANVSGVRLPDAILEFKGLDYVTEVSKHARNNPRWILTSSATPDVFHEGLGGCFVAEAFSGR